MLATRIFPPEISRTTHHVHKIQIAVAHSHLVSVVRNDVRVKYPPRVVAKRVDTEPDTAQPQRDTAELFVSIAMHLLHYPDGRQLSPNLLASPALGKSGLRALWVDLLLNLAYFIP